MPQGYEEILAFVPDTPALLETCLTEIKPHWRWKGEVEITRRQYSLWIGNIFIGEVVFDRNRELWCAELSTQKYLRSVGRYKTEIAAHDALLDAAVDAVFGK